MNRELRVFISSTFRDLIEEREQLTKKVFPALRALCRERGVEFTEIDLRWGLTDEEAHNGKIIRTCFEEIDACRPYFIGIVGSRYGWVPGFAEIQKDPLLIKRFPWVEDAALDGTSILEMEFDYAALRDSNAAESAFFYLRRDRGLNPRFSDPHSHDNDEKLNRLRERVRTSGLPCKEYSGAETLGEMIYDDLLETINRNWPQEEASTIERERYQHEAFAATRRHAYIANPDRIRRIKTTIRNEKRSVVVEAPSGSGKSALLAYWSHTLRENDPKQFIIEHYVGAGGGTGDAAGVAQHIIHEIVARYDLPDEVPTKPEDCLTQLSSWLARVTDSCIIVLDAVNQLDEASRTLRWLPEHLPPTVTCLVSTTDGELATSLSERGWARETLEPLEEDEREAIIIRYLNEFHKSLSLDQSKRIATDPKCSSPLFIRTMLEELRLVGSHKHLDSIIDRYLSAHDTDELFQFVLERLEEDFGSRTVRELMSFIWASRNGLSHRELGELMPITHMRLSSLLIALDYHLQRHGGMLTFFHQYLRRAVEARYLHTEEKKMKVHIAIAEYESVQPLSPRYITEEPWQWKQAEKWDELAACLTKTERLSYYFTDLYQYEFLSYWLVLGQHANLHKLADATIQRLVQIEEPEERAKLIGGLGWIFYLATDFPEAEKILRQALEHCSTLDTDHAVTIDLTTKLAHALQSLGQSEAAETLLTSHLARLQESDARDARNLHTIRRVLAYLYYERGDFLKAATVMEEIIGSMDLIDSDIEKAEMYSTYGAVLHELGQYQGSGEKFSMALQIRSDYYGVRHPVVAQDLNNLATAQSRLNKLSDALKNIEIANSICAHIFGPSHIETLKIVMNKALIYQQAGDLEEAYTLLKSVQKILVAKYGKGHILSIKCSLNLAGVARSLKHWEEAENLGIEAAELRSVLLGAHHPDTINAQFNLARTFAESGKLESAHSLMNSVLALRHKQFGETDGVYQRYLETASRLLPNLEISKKKSPTFNS
jgi:nephrocystin-3